MDHKRNEIFNQKGKIMENKEKWLEDAKKFAETVRYVSLEHRAICVNAFLWLNPLCNLTEGNRKKIVETDLTQIQTLDGLIVFVETNL